MSANKPSVQKILFDMGMGIPKNFDVAIGSIHTLLSYCVLNFAWGEHYGQGNIVCIFP
jgi:hypothetical protein